MTDRDRVRALRPDWFPTRETTVEIAQRERARQEAWTETAALCPECHRPSIRRLGGEWCRWCRGYVESLTLYSPRDDTSYAIRTLRNANSR